MTPPQYPDSLCKRCGRCCYAKVMMKGEIYFTNIPCPHLDTSTNLCKVYEKRFEVDADCLSVADGIRFRVFPADCPYVENLSGYRPPHTDCDLEEMARIYRGED